MLVDLPDFAEHPRQFPSDLSLSRMLRCKLLRKRQASFALVCGREGGWGREGRGWGWGVAKVRTGLRKKIGKKGSDATSTPPTFSTFFACKLGESKRSFPLVCVRGGGGGGGEGRGLVKCACRLETIDKSMTVSFFSSFSVRAPSFLLLVAMRAHASS